MRWNAGSRGIRAPKPVVAHQFYRCKSNYVDDYGFLQPIIEARSTSLGSIIKDQYAHLKDQYRSPKHPIILAHGLMGFDELQLIGRWFPSVHYWRGIKEELRKRNIEVVTTAVPTTSSIEARAHVLHDEIRKKAAGKDVNIIAHSMGGLDSRYLISRIQPQEFKIMSLTTIATPHRGSSVADMILRDIGAQWLPNIYRLCEKLKIETGAFAQLTHRHVNEKFNPVTPNDPSVRYFSYGASATPHLFSAFRLSHALLSELEGPNDGLVSVASSKWGAPDGYKGTLMGVTHLDLINWTNRIKRLAARAGLIQQEFNAPAFYLAIADMLADEGL